jgi:hypothetical protein
LFNAERRQYRVAPWPLATRHGKRRILEVGRREGRHVIQLVKQGARDLGQGGDLFLWRHRHMEVERLAKTTCRRQAENRRPHEGEEFEQVARRHDVEAEPRCHRRRMANQRQAAIGAEAGVGGGNALDAAVRSAPQGAACRRDQGRPGREGRRHPRWIAQANCTMQFAFVAITLGDHETPTRRQEIHGCLSPVRRPGGG